MKVEKRKAFILVLIVILGAGCARKQVLKDKPAAVAIPVTATDVTTGDIEETLQVTGNIQATHDITLSSKIMGKVERVLIKEGQAVREGQILISLEDKDLRAQGKQAEAGLETAKARLEQSHSGLAIQTEASSAGVVQAETALASAKARLEQALQAKRLQERQSASNLEQAEAALEGAKVRVAQAESNKILTSDTVAAQLESARAQLAQAQASLDKVRSGARQQEKTQADAALAQAQSALDNARANLERATSLFSSGAVSKQQLDAAQLQHDVAKSDYEMALQSRNLVYEGARSEDVRLAEIQVEQAKTGVAAAEANVRQNDLREKELEAAKAGVRQAEAALDLARAGALQDAMSEQDVQQAREALAQAEAALGLAKVSTARTQISQEDIRLARAGVLQAEGALTLARSQLESATITSPVAGSVAKKMVDRGETVTPGIPLMRIVARGAVEFRAKVSEIDFRSVSVGQQVSVTADALPGETFVGSVAEVLPAAETATRSFELRIVVPNPKERLKEGMFARGEILIARKTGVVLLPKDAAIRNDDGSLHIFVVQGQKAKKADVVTGLEAVNAYEVVAGLSAGEKVVMSGQTALRDGDTVTIQPENGGGGE